MRKLKSLKCINKCIIWLSIIAIFAFTFGVNNFGWRIEKAKGANCGGETACNCGDTITSTYTMSSDLTCPAGNGFLIGNSGITVNINATLSVTGNAITINNNINGVTINGNGTGILDGDGGASDAGVKLLNGTNDNVTIQNFASIKEFGSGIQALGTSGNAVIGITITGNTFTTNNNGLYGLYTNGNITSNNFTANATSSTSKAVYLSNTASGVSSIGSNIFSGNTNDINIATMTSDGSSMISNNTFSNTRYTALTLSALTSVGVAGNTITNTGAISTVGIIISNSTGLTLANNTISGNQKNFSLSGTLDTHFANTIGTTNTLDGDPIYYLNNPTPNGTAETPLDYADLGNIGTFYCIDCTYLNLTNATIASNSSYGLYLRGSTNAAISGLSVDYAAGAGIYLEDSSNNNTISGTTITDSLIGVQLKSSTGNAFDDIELSQNTQYGMSIESGSNSTEVTNSTIYGNSSLDGDIGSGIRISASSSANIDNNTFTSNKYAIYFETTDPDPDSTSITNNTIKNNHYDLKLAQSTNNTITSNDFLDNISGSMITYADTENRIQDIGAEVDYSFTMQTPTGSACATCTRTVTISPTEEYTENIDSNTVSGSFTMDKSGIYSLVFTVTDSSGNYTRRLFHYYTGNTESKNERYYFRTTSSTHGQPRPQIGMNDAYTLLKTAPSGTEISSCGGWVQHSIDQLPNYPWSYLTGVDMNTIYAFSSASGFVSGNYYLTRFGEYIGQAQLSMRWQIEDGILPTGNYASTDLFDAIPYSSELTPGSVTDLNLAMDYFWNWYLVTLRLDGNGGGIPRLKSTAAVPSYADITYAVPNTPIVKSISNDSIELLSATAPADDLDGGSLVLSGTGSANIVLEDFSRPFLNYATTLSADGNATITGSSLSGTTTMDSVKMDIVPTGGSVAVSIDTWNTSGSHYRKWTETAASGVTTAHTIGDLVAGHYYNISVAGNYLGTYPANGSGQITFNYDGGYSAKIFELTEDTSPALTTIAISPTSPSGSNSWYTAAPTVTLSATDSEAGINKTYYRWGATGSYSEYSSPITAPQGENTLYYYSTDLAGNSETAKTQEIKVDTIAPALSTTPYTDLLTTTYNANISGTASDATSGLAFVTVNGVVVTNPSSFLSRVRLAMGSNPITIIATDNAGNYVKKIFTITRVLSRRAATPSVLSSLSILDTSQSNIPIPILDTNTTKPTINTQYPTFSGTTYPNSVIELEIHSNIIKTSTTSDASGNWSYTVTQPLDFGQHQIFITVKDTAGNTLESKNYYFTIVDKAEAKDITKPTDETEKKANANWIFYIAGGIILIFAAVIVVEAKRRKKL